MNKLDQIVFINNLPTIDLHGYDSQTARVAINDFINDNLKMKNEFFVVIHGIGSGILRRMTTETLSRNKKVLSFKTYYYNNGCTLVELDLEK